MKRLESIVSMVDKCEIAADIGSDHGYVAEMLFKENKCEKIIATDLNEGPLNRTIEHLSSKNFQDRCDFRLGNGLSVLKEGEADAIIIAGMGGELISKIIDSSKNIAMKSHQLILQPMTGIAHLRRYLSENSFEIVDEKIVREDHHFYFIIKAKKGASKTEDSIYYEISKILLDKKDPIMLDYINKLIDTNEKIIKSLEKANNMAYNVKTKKLKEKNKRIRDLI